MHPRLAWGVKVLLPAPAAAAAAAHTLEQRWLCGLQLVSSRPRRCCCCCCCWCLWRSWRPCGCGSHQSLHPSPCPRYLPHLAPGPQLPRERCHLQPPLRPHQAAHGSLVGAVAGSHPARLLAQAVMGLVPPPAAAAAREARLAGGQAAVCVVVVVVAPGCCAL
jgi:hypothetical protein